MASSSSSSIAVGAATTPSSSHGGNPSETAVPTLKVMRLQSPDLSQASAGSLDNKCLLSSALALPDSFGVIHVGETFTAYLGALNVSDSLHVRGLTVSAQLQTPSARLPLPSSLDAGNSSGGIDLEPHGLVDAIVSKALEEAGPHILRVEVGYAVNDNSSSGGSASSTMADPNSTTRKSLRKFYRFSVSEPLQIRELTVRAGDSSCFVSIALENISQPPMGQMTIASVQFVAADGLDAQLIGGRSALKSKDDSKTTTTTTSSSSITSNTTTRAVDMYDACGRLDCGESFRYMFLVRAASEDAKLRGVACGDELGKAVFTWRKAMGEAGRIASTAIICPEAEGLMRDGDSTEHVLLGGSSRFVVHGSGLSVDVAASAASRASSNRKGSTVERALDLLPVTVEPIDPPSFMELAKPQQVQFLVVNHSPNAMNLQLQMRLSYMSGIAVCGLSYKNLGEIPGSGGSCIVEVRLIALVAGLLRVQGCCMVELTTAQEIPQPPLFNVFVEEGAAEQQQQ